MTSSLTRRSLLYRSAAVVATVHTAGLTRAFRRRFQVEAGRADVHGGCRIQEGSGRHARASWRRSATGMSKRSRWPLPTLPEFKKMVADAGLGCPSGHFGFGFMPTEKVLDDAAALGVKYAVSSVLPAEQPKDSNQKSVDVGSDAADESPHSG